MKKLYIKRLLSLVMVLLVVFPVIVAASSPSSIIKKVYFQDEAGNMVFVDYEAAINQSLEGNNALYNGIKHYVGIAEAKGRDIYLETNTGKKIDFKLAMMDNLFRLEDIMTIPKYEVNREIEYTHELKVVDGNAEITVKAEPINIVRINPVSDITVNLGTPLEDVIGLLQPTTTIVDSKNEVHTVDLIWAIDNYNKDADGIYMATGRFSLPQGIDNGLGIALKVEAMVTVLAPTPEWPTEVEDVFVGISQITDITYANIEIKEDYISRVEAVYVDGNLANKIEGKPSQWRIEVAKGTTVEALRGRISITLKGVETPKDLEVKLDKEIYNIDEEIKLTGMASKEKIGLENVDITLKVVGEEGLILVEQLITGDGGRFSYTFNMPSDSIAGRYTIVIKGQEGINETVEINFMIEK